MDIVESNLSNETLSLIKQSRDAESAKKMLFVSNVVVSFVGKLSMPKLTIRARLPHRPTGLDVCVIVKDMKKGDYNASNDFWRRKWKLSAAYPSSISVTFLPLNELKLSYQSYESRRKLAATFDVFLADKRIVHHLPSNLGKAFYGNARNKIPIPVAIDDENLTEAIDKGLHSCLILISGKGTTESISVGRVDMPRKQIKENIVAVIRDVVDKWPGGLQNIRSIYIRGAGPSVPVYFDNTNADEVKSKVGFCELKGQTRHVAKLSQPQLPRQAFLEVAKDLPVSEKTVKSLLRKKAPKKRAKIPPRKRKPSSRLRVKRNI